MWIRCKNGTLIEITRDTYFTDRDYYVKLTKTEMGITIKDAVDSKNIILSILDVKDFDKKNI